MEINRHLLSFLILGISLANSLNLSPAALVKTLHKGAYEAVKGTVNTVTEVVGTPVDIKDVHLFLHTSKDHGYPNHTIDPLQPSEIATKDGRVYFLIHGWTQSRAKTPWYRPLTEYLLKKHPDAHVVQVDWGKAAANNYPSAAFGTESVGNIIGDVIKKLVVDYKVPRKNIVLIGHSLGGQITGWVGKRFRKLTKTTLPRIVALDPAGPLFSSRPEDKRLNKHDADIVMVLHSDGGKLGFGSSCGSIDFFPNGGSDQPGCYKVDLADVSTLTEPIWCDHQRGYDLFLEAVKSPCLFLARKCENYNKFKENKCEDVAVSLGDLEASSAGSYYFKTTDKAPFIEVDELKKNGRVLEHSSTGRNEECSTLLKNHKQGNDNLREEGERHSHLRDNLKKDEHNNERNGQSYHNSNPGNLNRHETREQNRYQPEENQDRRHESSKTNNAKNEKKNQENYRGRNDEDRIRNEEFSNRPGTFKHDESDEHEKEHTGKRDSINLNTQFENNHHVQSEKGESRNHKHQQNSRDVDYETKSDNYSERTRKQFR